MTIITEKELKELIAEAVEEVALPEGMIPEGGYSKLMTGLAGLDPNINTLGIVTAENPMAQEIPAAQNKMRNRELAKDIRDQGYGFYQIGGKYGNIEKPYVIPNVSINDVANLGKKYEQESVIFVEKTNDGMVARLITTMGDTPEVSSKVVLPLAQDIEDFYSIYKGRKFQIPFFDDFFADKKLVKGKIEKDGNKN